MGTLEQPVYKLKKQSTIFKLYKERQEIEELVQSTFERLFKERPELKEKGVLAIWSENTIGIQTGTDQENMYHKELTVKHKQGYRLLRKDSELRKHLVELSEGAFRRKTENYASFQFEAIDVFGINNLKGTHFLNEDLYVSFNNEPSNKNDLLEAVKYSDYIEEYAKYVKSNEEEFPKE